MSLKMFHLVFIMAAVVLAVGFGIWLLVQGGAANVICAVLSFAAAAGLIVYERYFLKKTKNVSYL